MDKTHVIQRHYIIFLSTSYPQCWEFFLIFWSLVVYGKTAWANKSWRIILICVCLLTERLAWCETPISSKHMSTTLNETEIEKLKCMEQVEDVVLWNNASNKFSRKLDSKRTWELLRDEKLRTKWYKWVSFKHTNQGITCSK